MSTLGAVCWTAVLRRSLPCWSLLLLLPLGCRDISAKRSARQNALAVIDESTITVGDLEERLNNQSPYVRARYASLEQKKDFLDNLIKFELLANEAKRQGIDRDPEVVRTMKQVMIQKLLKSHVDKLKPEDIPDADVQKYFDAHPEEFNRPAEVRASLILVKDEPLAKKVAADPRALGIENLGFRQLVAEFSIDTETKERGGDLRFFEQGNRELPKPLVEAAFALTNLGDVSAPIRTPSGYAILKLTGQRRPLVRALPDVTPQIRAKLFRDKRQHVMDDYEATLKKQARLQVFPERLTQVKVDLTQATIGAPDELRPAAGTGDFHPIGQRAPQAGAQQPSVPAPSLTAPPTSTASTAAAPKENTP